LSPKRGERANGQFNDPEHPSSSHQKGGRRVYSRREFLKVAPLAGGAVLLNYRKPMSKSFGTGYFGLDEFI
jgi:hypothetical protein